MNTLTPVKTSFKARTLKSNMEPLTIEQMQAATPSIFAENPHTARSDTYRHVNTLDVLKRLESNGFFPHMVKESGARDLSKFGYTKHQIRFRKQGDVQKGDTIREIILINSHDGASSYQLMSGLFRIVCLNGLAVAEGNEVHKILVPHKGKDVLERVISGVEQIYCQAEAIDGMMDKMKSVVLNQTTMEELAKEATKLRFGTDVQFKGGNLLEARRVEDQGSDLWTVFNRIQENAVKGGQQYLHTNEKTNVIQLRKTRPIENITTDVEFNQQLWKMAVGFA